MVNIMDVDNIYFSKTRVYFNEVLSSYSNGNYRSAVVMLYSVAVCDLLYKLQELRDMYDDSVAKKILIDVESYRASSEKQSKARWEKELIDNIYKDTELLSLEEITNLNHLFDHRNFSAHPALNINFELIAPSRESTIAHMRNILSGILVKPPIFISNIVEMMTTDLDEKRELYQGQDEKLQEYLNRKYFERMPLSMKKRTFKAYWKFCFCMPDDENCKRNRKINRRVLQFLFEDTPSELIEYIKHENFFAATSPNKACVFQLCVFLAECPSVYGLLSSDTKLQIKSLVSGNSNAKVVSWFLTESMESHIKQLIADEVYGEINLNITTFIAAKFMFVGLTNILMDYFISYFSKSSSFDNANSRYSSAIQPYLSYMSKEHFLNLLNAINSNSQIYNRGKSYNDNTEIMLSAKNILTEDFNFKIYPHFCFNEADVYENGSTFKQADENTNLIDEIQF